MIRKDIIARAERNIREAREDPPPVSGDQDADFINKLFKSLFAAKPGWRASYPGLSGLELDKAVEVTKRSWTKAFYENGINSDEQVKTAMRQARKDPNKFLPSVGEFMEWTKPDPKEMGIPTAEEAWREATRYCFQFSTYLGWSHAIVPKASREMGLYDLKHMNARDSIREFKKAYSAVLERLMKGEVIEMPKVITHKPYSKKTRTQQNIAAKEKAIAEMRKGL